MSFTQSSCWSLAELWCHLSLQNNCDPDNTCARRCKNGPDLSRIARDRRLSLSKLRLGYGNPAHQEVRVRGLYWLSYSNFMLVVHLCIYFCVYLSQAVSCPPCIGMEWDLFCRVHLVNELHSELMLVTSRVVVPPLPAEQLRSGQHVRAPVQEWT